MSYAEPPEEMSIIGYMRSPLIPSSLHLCQTLGEKGGTKRGCGGMEAEVKEEAGGGEERERRREGWEKTRHAEPRRETGLPAF